MNFNDGAAVSIVAFYAPIESCRWSSRKTGSPGSRFEGSNSSSSSKIDHSVYVDIVSMREETLVTHQNDDGGWKFVCQGLIFIPPSHSICSGAGRINERWDHLTMQRFDERWANDFCHLKKHEPRMAWTVGLWYYSLAPFIVTAMDRNTVQNIYIISTAFWFLACQPQPVRFVWRSHPLPSKCTRSTLHKLPPPPLIWV